MTVNGENDRRNQLAALRTDLANERTLLAYVRTALMSAGSGLTLIKFFADISWAPGVGLAFLVLGAAIALVGVIRFATMRTRVSG